MTELEKQVLNFFCLLEIALGLWMISSPLGSQNVVQVIELYSPLWLLGVIFIIGGFIKLLAKKTHLWAYIGLVSVPLVFFGLVFAQVAVKFSVFTSSVIIFNFVGFYSAIYAGQVYRKRANIGETIIIKKVNGDEHLP